jgi:PKHD-type hydroxylase
MWLLRLDNLLDAAQVERLTALIAGAPFVDGRATAGANAATVKHNQQLDRTAWPTAPEAEQLVLKAILEHPRVQALALPVRAALPIFARYRPGMAYGQHCDRPFMGQLRSDISCTLFLSEPASYDGGELRLEAPGAQLAFKLNRGAAIFYPAGTIHQVAEVTRGERLVAVTWLQSRIADHHQRSVLSDVERLGGIMRQRDPHGPESLLAGKIAGDLTRMWAEGV